ncbi:unnamed protein product [Chrysodeixis includens]|uniref:BUD13 homolog n=1 Tax=Chrysodeixis includens TaxID=689277 RepID=A0A9P0BYR5_CHRIL|nr:unnamed protein product [Chrysodeixis includens]
MAANINQKAYLQKYLSGPSGEKKKKKKKAVKGAGLKIIDDDIDLSKLRPLDGDELDILDQGEDAPQIAGIIDERPEEVKKAEQFSISSKWKVVNQDDGFNSKLEIKEIKSDIKQVEKENELIFGKMYSDSEDEKKNDSDASPPRKPNNDQAKSKPSKKHDSDSDFSPPRRNERSPKRSPSGSKKERSRKPSRWGDFGPETVSTDHSPKREYRNSSPPRKSRKDTSRRTPSSDQSPPRKSRNNDSDVSPPRKSRKNDSDESPPRKNKRNHDSRRNGSPSKKSRKNYDSDASPSRKSKSDGRRPEPTSPSKKRRHSPERQNYKDRNDKYNSRQDRSRKHRHSPDSDMSPPRKNKRKSISPNRKQRLTDNKRKYNSDSDQSPPRKNNDRSRRNDSPPPSNKKMAKTLAGMTAGLQDAKQLRKESEQFREKEEEVFKKMSDEVSGRNAQVVSRKSKRETSEDRQKQKEKAERQKVLDEKYKKWSRGIKQIQDQESRVAEFLHEASKPLARHKDDRDLEDNLKQVERAGDPMLKYIRERKRERGELGPEKPMYKGNYPINRFGIRPGYRWDGVDRSNGYEKKYFDQQSKRKAQEEEAYKWSIEDL